MARATDKESTEMRQLMLTIILLGASWTASLQAQTSPPKEEPRATASDGGTVELLPEQPVADPTDPANVRSSADTVDGLAVVVTIDRGTVTLDSAALARVPRHLTQADRKLAGDLVKASGFSKGQLVTTSVASDNVVNAEEGGGLVRTEKRQVAIMLAADRPLDRVDIEAPATNAKGSVDVGSAYALICDNDPKSKWCPRGK
jgi:hypothetical protein